ncbi:MAG: hypothetical protein KDA90_21940, partial [Planctomycetaceae bacterium]|nr:hypothetical protein [Planctomycetaceae bacterium]
HSASIAPASVRPAKNASAATASPAALIAKTAAVATASMRVAVPPVMTLTWIPKMPNHKPHPLTRRHLRRPRRKRQSQRPVLTFTPTAWAKLLYLRDLGPTEVGGFGITEPDDLLCVRDIGLVQQQCTETFVSFDDLAVAEFFESQVDAGRQPQQVGRIWIHTHPGDSAQPSSVDEETFSRAFGHCDWAIMAILARGGETFAQLHWRHGGGSRISMRVDVRFDVAFAGSDHDAWQEEYAEHVQDCSHHVRRVRKRRFPDDRSVDPLDELLLHESLDHVTERWA